VCRFFYDVIARCSLQFVVRARTFARIKIDLFSEQKTQFYTSNHQTDTNTRQLMVSIFLVCTAAQKNVLFYNMTHSLIAIAGAAMAPSEVVPALDLDADIIDQRNDPLVKVKDDTHDKQPVDYNQDMKWHNVFAILAVHLVTIYAIIVITPELSLASFLFSKLRPF
jgi:hypothetical protein